MEPANADSSPRAGAAIYDSGRGWFIASLARGASIGRSRSSMRHSSGAAVSPARAGCRAAWAAGAVGTHRHSAPLCLPPEQRPAVALRPPVTSAPRRGDDGQGRGADTHGSASVPRRLRSDSSLQKRHRINVHFHSSALRHGHFSKPGAQDRLHRHVSPRLEKQSPPVATAQ